MTDKAWSIDEEHYHQDFCSITYDAEVGDIYWEGDVVHMEPLDYVTDWTISNFLEMLDDQLYQEGPQDMDHCFQDVTPEEQDELKILVQGWVEKHVKIPYFTVKNVVEKRFTKEDLE